MSANLLSQLKPGLSTSKVCVRVSRMWDCYEKDDETVKHLDLVILDEKVNSITNEYLYIAIIYLYYNTKTER
uniref:DUF223 domain-containing protein n=1 Tax=Arundo donax TaxID=35708 RepID=A0A0A8YGH2_ARUDO